MLESTGARVGPTTWPAERFSREVEATKRAGDDMGKMTKTTPLAAVAMALALGSGAPAAADPAVWQVEWPKTDFTRTLVDFSEILSGGPPKDGIPSIDDPSFASPAEVELPAQEAVIAITSDREARAYPLRILMWHEIVNDSFDGRPIAVTWCPLCNTGIVFDRTLDGETLEFGTTGLLRHSDLVMYDRSTESWWQQFTGQAIVGELTGATLEMLPSRLESWAMFQERNAERDMAVLVPDGRFRRDYGRNPYVAYDDERASPFLFRGELPEDIPAMARVVRVDNRAWSLALLRKREVIETDDLRLSWTPGQASALDASRVADGRDVGNVVVERRTAEGWEDAVYSVDFAFAFLAFFPDSEIVIE